MADLCSHTMSLLRSLERRGGISGIVDASLELEWYRELEQSNLVESYPVVSETFRMTYMAFRLTAQGRRALA